MPCRSGDYLLWKVRTSRENRRRRHGLIILILGVSSLVGLLVTAPSVPTAHALPSAASVPSYAGNGDNATSANPLMLDSSASVTCNGCTTQSLQLRMIQGDLVVVQTVVSPQSSTSRGGGIVGLASPGSLVSPTTTAFQQRFAWDGLLPIYQSVADETFVWVDWAVANASAVTTITGTVNGTEAAWSMVAYSVSGANTTEPWDPNPVLPVTQIDNDCNIVDGCGVDFSTTSADTMVIVGLGSEGCPSVAAPSNPGSGANFTLIASTCNPWSTDAVAYQLFSSPQNNTATGSWLLDGGQGESALWYADAIQACESSCPKVTPPVTQSVSVDMSNSAPAANVSITGCYAYPETFMSDGKPHLITMSPSCVFTLSFSNGVGVRDGFSVSGSFNDTSSPLTSCASGTCSPVSVTAYEELENAYVAKPVGYLTWDAAVSIPVLGTQLGVTDQQGCTILTSKGAGAADCEAWFDYGAQAEVTSPVVVSSTEEWVGSGVANFTQSTAGNRNSVTYVDEFQVNFLATPAGAGNTTTPSAVKAWETYGSVIPVTATPAAGYLFKDWSTSTALITFASASGSTTTATILGSGNITANFSAPVAQPITLSLVEESGEPASFAVSGCGISVAQYVGNGESRNFDVLPSCQLVITVQTKAPDVRYGFDADGTITNTTSFVTCAADTCPGYSTVYYEQINEEFSYNVTGGSTPYVEAPSISYVSLGTPTTSPVSGYALSIWLDSGSPWSLTNPLSGSTATERWYAPSGTAGTATAGGIQVVTYQHQFSVLITVSPSACGSTDLTGLNWEDAGDGFQVVASPASDCAFSSWKTAGTITVPQPGQLSATVFANSNGTLVASFTKNLLPPLPSTSVLVLVGLGVVAATLIGLFLARDRHPHP